MPSDEGRLVRALEDASDAFFKVIADTFGLRSGDVDPGSKFEWDEFAERHARRFVEDNRPARLS